LRYAELIHVPNQTGLTTKFTDGKTVAAICCGLVLIIALTYAQSLWFGFINYDDNTYVYANPKITHGLSVSAVNWAFTHIHSSNWHPLTTISHMLDCQLYGVKPGGHHLTNLIFHSLATTVLFLVLRNMTGAIWRSAFVAAIFAVHPLHVESVAWISERKDVLSAFFFFLTLGAYVRYARSPSILHYLVAFLLFAAGLMAKPMLVTAPFVLLLLDYWPLNRFAGQKSIVRLLAEKIPLLLLSAGSAVATIFAQRGVLIPTQQIPVWWRMGNALVSYVVYLKQTVWPTGLAAFYPILKDDLQLWRVAAAIILLVVITAVAIALRKTRPYIFTGWFWYVGMLLPVIGVVQVGMQAHADRYAYLPQIGIGMIMAWGTVDLAKRFRTEIALRFAAPAVIALLAFLAWRQTGLWRNSEVLWTRMLAVTGKNDLAHYGLGDILLRQGKFDEAIEQFRTTLKLRPHWPYAEDYLGLALLKAGRVDEAIEHFVTVLRLMPSHPTVHYDLGNALFQKGDIDDAIELYQEGLKNQPTGVMAGFVQPDYAAAHYDLGNCYVQKRDPERAISEYREAVKLSPDAASVHNNLAFALSQIGQTRQAIAEWQEALRLDPKNIEVLGNIGWVHATSSDSSFRDGERAVDLAQQALQISQDNPKILRVLAAAQAEIGKFEQAIQTARQGLELADRQGDRDSADSLRSDLLLYESKRPLRN
jgi:tetratricopeptide (TPR) repeat protein